MQNKRYIIEVFQGDRRIEYRDNPNKWELIEELKKLKEMYAESNCVFYFGELRQI